MSRPRLPLAERTSRIRTEKFLVNHDHPSLPYNERALAIPMHHEPPDDSGPSLDDATKT